jgi:Uncharacterized conserved protein (DUF2278)/Lamin Tail Domain
MNQGNSPAYAKDDGTWQDGGLLIHFPDQDPSRDQWVAIFLKYQSQAWHTDDVTGHELPSEDRSDGHVRIVAALVNTKTSPEEEFVTLLNTTPEPVSLAGWAIADSQKNKLALSGTLEPGAAKRVKVVAPAALSNKGGIITLLNAKGLKVDCVSYTKTQAKNPGWTIVF